jgi:response regulator RpfG family c-di-GMP phosphodiesterase
MKNDKKILILEQDGLVALDLKRELEKENFTVKRANSMVASEIIIASGNKDLVIANTNVQTQPFFDKIKNLMKKCQLPLIWIGTLSDNEAMKASEGIKVVGAFSKPFKSKDVVSFVVNYFKKRIKPLLFKKENCE